MTNLFAERQEAYRQLMSRIHKYIIAVRKAETKAWEDKSLQENPTIGNDKGRRSKKVLMVEKLTYGKDEALDAGSSTDAISRPFGINEVRREDCANEEILGQRSEVRNFLLRMRWQASEEEEGGIAWLELHALFRVHGGRMGKEEQDVRPGQDPIASNQSMNNFKAAVRWTAARGIAKADEWHFATSYARANRLAPLGITNKQAAIKGMPILEESEAKAVAKEILLARGLLKTKKTKKCP